MREFREIPKIGIISKKALTLWNNIKESTEFESWISFIEYCKLHVFTSVAHWQSIHFACLTLTTLILHFAFNFITFNAFGSSNLAKNFSVLQRL